MRDPGRFVKNKTILISFPVCFFYHNIFLYILTFNFRNMAFKLAVANENSRNNWVHDKFDERMFQHFNLSNWNIPTHDTQPNRAPLIDDENEPTWEYPLEGRLGTSIYEKYVRCTNSVLDPRKYGLNKCTMILVKVT